MAKKAKSPPPDAAPSPAKGAPSTTPTRLSPILKGAKASAKGVSNSGGLEPPKTSPRNSPSPRLKTAPLPPATAPAAPTRRRSASIHLSTLFTAPVLFLSPDNASSPVQAALDVLPMLLLIVVGWVHVRLAPYTKVEESFSLQATHDILAFGLGNEGLKKFDHLSFPGAVPRSFVPPLLLAILVYPIALMAKLVGWSRTSADVQLLVRLVLSTCHSLALLCLIRSLTTHLSLGRSSRRTRRAWIVISASQFHSMFWGGRTTPNGLVMPLVFVALSWLVPPPVDAAKPRSKSTPTARQPVFNSFERGILLLTFCSTIFRLELVGLLLPASLWGLATERITFARLVLCGAIGGFGALSISVPLDTFLWRRPFRAWSPFTKPDERGFLWPELEAMLFNVVEGKSAEWGVSPPYAYFTSFLPRLLSFQLPLVLLGSLIALTDFAEGKLAQSKSSRPILLLYLGLSHVLILSCLGHKEARFIAYTVPLWNGLASVGSSRCLSLFSTQSLAPNAPRRRYLLLIPPFATLAATLALTTLSVLVSMRNYPGGVALNRLHRAFPAVDGLRLHITPLPSMTGVSLFQSIHLARPATAALAIGSFAPLRNRSTGEPLRLPSPFPALSPAVKGDSSLAPPFWPWLSPSSTSSPPLVWSYDKAENLPRSGEEAVEAWTRYDALITEYPHCAVIKDCASCAPRASLREGEGRAEKSLFIEDPLVRPVTSFAGFRIKTLRESAVGFKLALMSGWGKRGWKSRVKHLSPVVIKRHQVVWVCRRVGGKLDGIMGPADGAGSG